MPFTFALWHCLQEGKTSFKEGGTAKTAKLDPENDECVLVIHTDCESFRQRFNLVGKKASDVLFFLKKRNEMPKLIFVEIKGGSLQGSS